MDEGIWHGMDAWLGWHFHVSMAFFHEGLFEQIDDGSHFEVDRFNIGTREIEQFMS
jgi:hypothetical protein